MKVGALSQDVCPELPPAQCEHLLQGLRIAVVAPFAPPKSGIMYQAEVLTQCFTREGASVLPVTYVQNRLLRPLATLFELVWRRGQYDVVCCQGFSYKNWINSALAVSVARVLGKRTILVYRGGAFAEFVGKYGWAVLPTLRRVDQLVTPSAFLAAEFGRRSLNVIVIPNVIEVSEWPHRRRLELPPRLLWVRHLRTGYNPFMALEVLQKVQYHYPDATLRMAGDGDREAELRTAIAQRQIPGVTLLGHISGRQLAREYDAGSIFINTTNYDNQPRSVLEAMACGLPVVSTNVGGIPYMLEPGRHAVLVPPNDADAMATAILRLIRSPGGALAMADAARAHVEKFSWKPDAERFDIIVSRASINHIFESPRSANRDSATRARYVEIAGKFRRALKPGGVALVSDVCRYGFFSMTRSLGLRRPWQWRHTTINWRLHQNPQTWKAIFLEAGFGQAAIVYPVPYPMRHFGPFVRNPVVNFFLLARFLLKATA